MLRLLQVARKVASCNSALKQSLCFKDLQSAVTGSNYIFLCYKAGIPSRGDRDITHVNKRALSEIVDIMIRLTHIIACIYCCDGS